MKKFPKRVAFRHFKEFSKKVAARQGFEPRLRVPKTPVLPLHHQATTLKMLTTQLKSRFLLQINSIHA